SLHHAVLFRGTEFCGTADRMNMRDIPTGNLKVLPVCPPGVEALPASRPSCPPGGGRGGGERAPPRRPAFRVPANGYGPGPARRTRPRRGARGGDGEAVADPGLTGGLGRPRSGPTG